MKEYEIKAMIMEDYWDDMGVYEIGEPLPPPGELEAELNRKRMSTDHDYVTQ